MSKQSQGTININKFGNEPAILTMTITPMIEAILKKYAILEIEMLQGTREEQEDGRIYYKVEIHDPWKAEVFKNLLLQMISDSQNLILN
ncbi:MAG: hypothetical protein ACJ748_01620 [Flavisolibacter sp.]